MKLSVVLLTWNSEKYVANCLNSFISSTDIDDYEIIIVDNGSSDNTLDIISKQFPSVRLIRNKTNKGVATARNQCIKASTGDYILILDIDTSVQKGAVDLLLDYMDRHPEVGLCGPQLCFEDGTIQNSFRRFPLIQTKILRRINTNWARKMLKNEYYDLLTNCQEAIEADYVIGACQLIRRSVIEKVGLLDDRIFYGPEDVDFCLRIWLNGFAVIYFPDARITHYEQRITKGKFFSYISFKHMQGLMHYFIKHRYFFSRRSVYRSIKNR